MPVDETYRPSKCQRCKGTGSITVEGGAADEKLDDICPDCEGTGKR